MACDPRRRNAYRHAYDNIAERRIWQTVQRDLQPLSEVVAIELDALGYSTLSPDVPLTDTQAWLRGVSRDAPEKGAEPKGWELGDDNSEL